MRRGRRLHLVEVGVRWPPETFLGWRFEALARRGYRVTVLTPRSRRHGPGRLEGVARRTLPEPAESRARVAGGVVLGGVALLATRPLRARRLAGAVRQSLAEDELHGFWATLQRLRLFLPLARLRPDVVHFEWNPEAVRYLPLAEVWNCPTVSSCHGSGVNVIPHAPHEGRFRRALPGSFRRATAVHCVSDAIVREAGRYGLEPAKARLIRSAVDPVRFRPPEEPRAEPDALRVVAVGWVRWLKGYEYALEAIRLLVQRDVPVRLQIVGSDPIVPRRDSDEIGRLLYTVEDLGLTGIVGAPGDASSDEVLAALQASDALMLPSLTEGLPTVLLEAMACELPVVATDCGGVREAVRDGVDGFVVPPRHPGEMADALQVLWERPELRAQMGRAGRERVLAAFTLDDQVSRFADMYETVVAAHAGARP